MKTTKEVTIIARYQFKNDPRKVVYLVRSSDGKSEYCTTLIDGVASGCSCPARNGKCYHRAQLEAREEARWATYRQELARKLAAQYVTAQCVEQIAESLVETVAQPVVPPIAMELPAEMRGYRKTAVSSDLSTKGSLNGAQQSAGLLMALPSRKARAS
jgi:hypothetical protein